MINIQPIEKSIQRADGVLAVHSIFKTIQGEGIYCGYPAVFVRLAGCNLQCPGCDTIYTGSGVEMLSPAEIVDRVGAMSGSSSLVVITGGEPFRQNITPLVDSLVSSEYRVQVETNGTLPPPPGLSTDVVVICSPKTGKLNKATESIVAAYKYVVAHDSVGDDGLPILALGHTASPRVARPKKQAVVYLQPMDSKDEETNRKNLDTAVSSCLEHGYVLQLQIHKIIGVE